MANVARRAGSLTPGGQWAAFATGTLVFAAGWRWAALLIGYFILSTALTRFGQARKAARTASVLPTVTERNALQVAANGGLYAILVLWGALTHDPWSLLAGIGALAAAAADTWATELGTLYGGTPRSILTGSRLEPGVSGGVTITGTLGSVVAAALMALLAPWLLAADGSSAAGDRAADAGPLSLASAAIFVAGVGGSLGDSVLGATLQSKRWCEQCRTWTERRVHTCQYRTQHARGVRWMTNDTVNFLATVLGALLALAAAFLLR